MIRTIFASIICLFMALPVLADSHKVDEGAAVPDKAVIEQIVRDYLVRNPEVIVEALQEMQRREQLAEAERSRAVIAAHMTKLDDPTGRFVAGNPDGDVTVVEFFDYRCSYCKRAFPALMEAITQDGNVRLVFKEFPILGEDSVLAARAAIAAARQDRYYDMHVALMQERGSYSLAKVLAIALDLGLDIEALRRDMDAPEVDAAISTNYELARALNITGTPGFIIGDQVVPGAISTEQMLSMIARARDARG
ncbi:MAG: DsbA family protein [Minwuia sp.]|nr:DsbA family protein [Minwuia sp.]